MKYDSVLQENCIGLLLSDGRFRYNGYTGTHWITTWEKGDEDQGGLVDLCREHSLKSLAKIRVLVFSNRYSEEGLNFKIELNLSSYCEWETFFEGWVDSLDEFRLILKSVGICIE